MLHVIGSIIVIAIAWRILFGNEDKKTERYSPPVMSPYSQQPPVPTNVMDRSIPQMVEHSRQTGAHIQVVEKAEIVNGNLTAERHVKISQPYASPQPIARSACVFPAPDHARKYERSYRATARFQESTNRKRDWGLTRCP